MEELVLQHMISKVGWELGDGIFTPGGTISNLYAVLMARYNYDTMVKMDGVGLHKFALFTSEHVRVFSSICNQHSIVGQLRLRAYTYHV